LLASSSAETRIRRSLAHLDDRPGTLSPRSPAQPAASPWARRRWSWAAARPSEAPRGGGSLSASVLVGGWRRADPPVSGAGGRSRGLGLTVAGAQPTAPSRTKPAPVANKPRRSIWLPGLIRPVFRPATKRTLTAV
jgi:hypothetical protein